MNYCGAVARETLTQRGQQLFPGRNPHAVASETFSDEVEAEGTELAGHLSGECAHRFAKGDAPGRVRTPASYFLVCLGVVNLARARPVSRNVQPLSVTSEQE